jgi:hypothetical protein
MKRKIVGMAVVAMVLGMFVAGNVHAATTTSIPGTPTEASKGGEEQCKADEAKFCPDAVKTKGNRIECLKARQSELDAKCAKWVDRHHEVFKAREKACVADYTKFCPKDHSYDARVKCLQASMDKLAGDCKATFSK